MNGSLAYLGSGRFLILLLALAIVVGVAFGVFGGHLGGPLLDMLSDPSANEARLAAMTADQRSTHMWITLTLDVIYPFAYGGGLANLAARFADRNKLLFAGPGLLLILVDLIENALIVAMLGGDTAVIHAKALVTLIKWWLFGGCSLLVMGLAAWAAIRHYTRDASESRISGRASREI
jgi:hypothetical protein